MEEKDERKMLSTSLSLNEKTEIQILNVRVGKSNIKFCLILILTNSF